MTQPLGRQGRAEGAGVVLRTVVAEHGADLDPVAPVVGQQTLEKAHRDGGIGSRAHHEPDEGPAGEDVDGAELVHLAHALELADVEAVDADELARTARSEAEPEGLVVSGRLSQKSRRRCRDRRGPGQSASALVPSPWSTRCCCTVDLAMAKPWSPSRSAYWRQPMVGSRRPG